jgi:hypothetical protein
MCPLLVGARLSIRGVPFVYRATLPEEATMKYMLLIYGSEAGAVQRSPEEMGATVKEYVAVAESLKERGQFLAAERLQPTSTATSVRVKDGKTLTTDGPFAETKEQLGGFYFIEAKDLDEAIAVAARLPAARSGCIEVRPIFAM